MSRRQSRIRVRTTETKQATETGYVYPAWLDRPGAESVPLESFQPAGSEEKASWIAAVEVQLEPSGEVLLRDDDPAAAPLAAAIHHHRLWELNCHAFGRQVLDPSLLQRCGLDELETSIGMTTIAIEQTPAGELVLKPGDVIVLGDTETYTQHYGGLVTIYDRLVYRHTAVYLGGGLYISKLGVQGLYVTNLPQLHTLYKTTLLRKLMAPWSADPDVRTSIRRVVTEAAYRAEQHAAYVQSWMEQHIRKYMVNEGLTLEEATAAANGDWQRLLSAPLSFP